MQQPTGLITIDSATALHYESFMVTRPNALRAQLLA